VTRRDRRPSGDAAGVREPITVDELLRPVAGAETDPPAPDADLPRAASILESLLLVSTEPISLDKSRQLLGGLNRGQVREVLALLRAKYPADLSGILVEEVAKGIQFRTNPANQEHVRRLFDVKPPRFSRAALGDAGDHRLQAAADPAGDRADPRRGLRRVVEDPDGPAAREGDGKKDVPGKPFLFGTTREFMETFSLGSLSELPSMRDIEDFLAASTGTAVGESRSTMHLPAIPTAGSSRAGTSSPRASPKPGRGGRVVGSGREDPGGRDRGRAVGRGVEGGRRGERARKWRLNG